MNVLVCGDFSMYNRGMESVDNGIAISPSICSVIKEYDVALVNLETPILCSKAIGIDKVGPHLKSSPNTISYLKECGFNYVTLANNHFYDYGEEGVKDTMNTLSRYHIESVGGGRNPNEIIKPLCLSGLENICILNYCESEFSVDHKMGSNKLDVVNTFYDIKDAISKDQFVIVIIHGGHEGYHLPSPRMKSLYRFFIDCGASIVINHHQHCFSGYEKYHQGMIFYGLGNFYFDSITKGCSREWYEGYMVGLNIQNGFLEGYTLYPYFQCKDGILESRLMDTKEEQEFYEHIERLNRIISNDDELQKEFALFAKRKEKQELVNLTPYSNRILQALYKRGLFPSFMSKRKRLQILNMLRCESHRDLGIWLLNKSNKYER